MMMKGTLQVSHKKKGLLGGGEIILGGGRPFPDWMRCDKNNLFCHMTSSQPLSRILAKATFDEGKLMIVRLEFSPVIPLLEGPCKLPSIIPLDYFGRSPSMLGEGEKTSGEKAS